MSLEEQCFGAREGIGFASEYAQAAFNMTSRSNRTSSLLLSSVGNCELVSALAHVWSLIRRTFSKHTCWVGPCKEEKQSSLLLWADILANISYVSLTLHFCPFFLAISFFPPLDLSPRIAAPACLCWATPVISLLHLLFFFFGNSSALTDYLSMSLDRGWSWAWLKAEEIFLQWRKSVSLSLLQHLIR